MIPYPLKGGIVSYTPLSTVFYRELARARPRTSLAPFRFNVFAAMAMVLPDVKMSSQRCPYLIQYNDTKDFEHPVCIFQKEIGRALSKKKLTKLIIKINLVNYNEN